MSRRKYVSRKKFKAVDAGGIVLSSKRHHIHPVPSLADWVGMQCRLDALKEELRVAKGPELAEELARLRETEKTLEAFKQACRECDKACENCGRVPAEELSAARAEAEGCEKENARLRAIEAAAKAVVDMWDAYLPRNEWAHEEARRLCQLFASPPHPEPRVGMKVRATKENWERWPWNAEIIGKDLDGHWLVRDCQNVVAPLGIVWEEDR